MGMFFGSIKIKSIWKSTFCGTLLIGILTHMFAMTNTLLTYDSIYNVYSSQNMISSGRQFLKFACGISSYYNLPWINGLLSIVWISVAAVLLVEVFRIEESTIAILLGGIIVSFPSVSANFAYMFAVDGYMLAFLLAVAAFFVTDRRKFGFAPGIVFMGVSIGIYQAYFSVTVILAICVLLILLLTEDDFKKILNKGVRYLIMGVGGYAFYVVTLKIMLFFQKDASLSGYQGTNLVMGNPFANLGRGVIKAYQQFFIFLLRQNVITANAFMTVAVWAIILFGIGAYVYLFFQKKRNNVIRIVCAVVLVLLMPIGATIVDVLSPDTYFHILMRLPWAILLVFAVVVGKMFLTEAARNQRKIRIRGCAELLQTIIAGVLIFCFMVSANIVYFNLNERYEKTYAVCSLLVDRLYNTEGYETGMPVAVVGGLPPQSVFPSTDITGNTVLKDYFGCQGDYVVSSTFGIKVFCEHYLGVTIEESECAYSEEWADELEEMELFPYAGSIKQIDGIWVVKFG